MSLLALFVLAMISGPGSWASAKSLSGFPADCKIVFRFQDENRRNWSEISSLRVVTYNMKDFNLSESTDQAGGIDTSGISTKGRRAEQIFGENFLRLDADILALQEVNPLALHRLQQQYLEGGYEVLAIPDRESVNGAIAFLVKKDLPFRMRLETHHYLTWRDPLDGQKKVLFQRGVPTLIISHSEESEPRLIVLGYHGKSKKHRYVQASSQVDVNSETIRGAQLSTLAQMVNSYKRRYPGATIMIAGDFNVQKQDPAMWALRSQLSDVFDVSPKFVEQKYRGSHVYFRSEERQIHQIDLILGSRNFLGSVTSAFVYYMRDERGGVELPPRTYAERELRVSDHMPVVADFDFQKLMGQSSAQYQKRSQEKGRERVRSPSNPKDRPNLPIIRWPRQARFDNSQNIENHVFPQLAS